MDTLLHLFCDVDDFCQCFLPAWKKGLLESGAGRRRRARSLCESEVMTILIAFHQSHYRNFKAFYQERVCRNWQREFPALVSYTRFVEFIPSVVVPLFAYLRHRCLGPCTGISFVDSTALAVCDNRRIRRHRVFAGSAQRGKTSMGWFYGFKLHFVVSDTGALLDIALTPGNVDDRKPVPQLAQRLFGKLFGDKGYLSAALQKLLRDTFGIELITKIKKGMKNLPMPLEDKLLLRKRAIVETIIDQIKNISQVEHTRHRSATGFLANLACALIAYSHQPKKPSLAIRTNALVIA